MEGFEKIKERITAAAEKERQGILSAAEAECRKIEREANFRIAESDLEWDEKAATAKAAKKRVYESSSALELRKELLAAKQQLIDRAFTEAEKQLSAMNTADTAAFLARQLKDCNPKPGDTVMFAEGLAESVCADLMKSFPGLNRGEPAADIKDGFVLLSGSSRQVCTYAAIIAARRDELEPEIATLLFD